MASGKNVDEKEKKDTEHLFYLGKTVDKFKFNGKSESTKEGQ